VALRGTPAGLWSVQPQTNSVPLSLSTTRVGTKASPSGPDWPNEIRTIHKFGPFTVEELGQVDAQTLEDYYYVTSWLLRENGTVEFKKIRDEFRGIFLRRLQAGLRLDPAADGSPPASARDHVGAPKRRSRSSGSESISSGRRSDAHDQVLKHCAAGALTYPTSPGWIGAASGEHVRLSRPHRHL